MGLKEYTAKRKFNATPEPPGKSNSTGKQLIFVVQRHDASRLHYDFRLEMEGVLKSWAVPKGPSLNVNDKRLAVMVEDHPYDYRTFTGIIPAGNYGAGVVEIFDEGIYTSLQAQTGKNDEDILLEELKKGDVKIVLKGKKLNGAFALVRMNDDEGKNWLLIKKKDEFALPEYDIESIKPLKPVAETLKKKPAKSRAKSSSSPQSKTTNSPVNKSSQAKTTASKPENKSTAAVSEKKNFAQAVNDLCRPMLAHYVDAPFDNADWVFEFKWDGYRTVATVNNNRVQLISRNNLSLNNKFGSIAKELEVIDDDVIIDGEVVALDDNGQPQFGLLQRFQSSPKGTLAYYIFDFIYLNGQPLTQLEWKDRRELLEMFYAKYKFKNVILSQYVAEKGTQLFEQAKEQELEGIIAKDIRSAYLPGQRSSAWKKIKTFMQQEAIIAGYTPPGGSRKKFGSLVLAVNKNGKLTYIGNCGSGFTDETLVDVYNKMQQLVQQKSPFDTKINVGAKPTWLKPELICQVKFAQFTHEGILRNAVFKGLRIDKSPKEVKMEIPEAINDDELKSNLKQVKQTSSSNKKELQEDKSQTIKPKVKEKASEKNKSPETKIVSLTSSKTNTVSASKTSFSEKELIAPFEGKNDTTLKVGAHEVKLSNLTKIYWPKEKYTKGHLVDYYRNIAPFILPYLKDRPESMNRYPNGIEQSSFYQKDVELKQLPKWIETVEVYSESNDKYINFLICQNEATLVYMANLGCIEINPWNSRKGSLENPDWLVIDLDPGEIDFKEVVKAALVTKEVFDSIGVESYCKTSGNTGLHIYVPMNAKYDYDQIKNFAEIIATLVHHQLPDTTSIERNPAKRKTLIYVDFLQNRRGQTLAAPYCVRPKAGATVSTPLKWDEVNADLHPSQFTIFNIFDRIEKIGDLWKPVIGKGIDIEKALNKLSA